MFRIRIGEELLYDKFEDGPYDPDEVVREVRDRL